MQETRTVHHVLQLQTRQSMQSSFGPWYPVGDDYLGEARTLAFYGELHRAIDTAYEAYIKKHGSAHNVQFRCRTTMEIITRL